MSPVLIFRLLTANAKADMHASPRSIQMTWRVVIGLQNAQNKEPELKMLRMPIQVKR
jgi:hypothetical protein